MATTQATTTRPAPIIAPRGLARNRSANMLPRPENSSIVVSTTAKPVVRSFSQRLAFSIRQISMNRNPRPSAGKNSTARAMPATGVRRRDGAIKGSISTTIAMTVACARTATLTTTPTSGCGRISSRWRMAPNWSSRGSAYQNGRSSVIGFRLKPRRDGVSCPFSTASASSAMASFGLVTDTVPWSSETEGRSLNTPARAAATSMPGYQDTSKDRASAKARIACTRASVQGAMETRMRTFQAER